jgi:hypothetical protein
MQRRDGLPIVPPRNDAIVLIESHVCRAGPCDFAQFRARRLPETGQLPQATRRRCRGTAPVLYVLPSATLSATGETPPITACGASATDWRCAEWWRHPEAWVRLRTSVKPKVAPMSRAGRYLR